jgi:hypothetical protein
MTHHHPSIYIYICHYFPSVLLLLISLACRHCRALYASYFAPFAVLRRVSRTSLLGIAG